MMDIEKLTDEDMGKIQKKYGLLAEKTKEDLKKGKVDTNTPPLGKKDAAASIRDTVQQEFL
jgi:hypothetical protein